MSGRIKVITTRDQIRGVADRWFEQYGHSSQGTYTFDHFEKFRQLEALDPAMATAEDVEVIIGNRSWTRLTCDVCQEGKEAVVQLGDEPDYDSTTLSACADCLEFALFRLSKTRGEVRP